MQYVRFPFYLFIVSGGRALLVPALKFHPIEAVRLAYLGGCVSVLRC
jgi:hypothetical protein